MACRREEERSASPSAWWATSLSLAEAEEIIASGKNIAAMAKSFMADGDLVRKSIRDIPRTSGLDQLRPVSATPTPTAPQVRKQQSPGWASR